ncbi:hypothetical protein [Jatrophihabitans sp.]|uniref:hypothetical protein n=1 Tax=Jatrophihabitans sp. TaxID=1932789 RepID=UPI0030C69563|nr:hypothetical protein [Jatrophihabitans sp.]
MSDGESDSTEGDGLEGGEVEELFDDEDDDEVSVAPRPRRVLAVFGIALAGFVFIAIAGAVLFAVLIFRVRDRADPNHTVRQKYQARYSHCVTQGGSKDSCSITVLEACEQDHWWTDPGRVDQRETVCLATVPKRAP